MLLFYFRYVESLEERLIIAKDNFLKKLEEETSDIVIYDEFLAMYDKIKALGLQKGSESKIFLWSLLNPVLRSYGVVLDQTKEKKAELHDIRTRLWELKKAKSSKDKYLSKKLSEREALLESWLDQLWDTRMTRGGIISMILSVLGLHCPELSDSENNLLKFREFLRFDDEGLLMVEQYQRNVKVTKEDSNSEHEEHPEIEKLLKKSDQLNRDLDEIDFFELDKVKSLDRQKQKSLVRLIAENQTPYQVAMLDYLGLFRHYLNEYGPLTKMYSHFSEILDVSARRISGNLQAMGEGSKQRANSNYNAWTYKNNVKREYHYLIQDPS